MPRRLRALLATAAALLLAYAALGFLVLPALIQARAPGALTRLLGRPVSLGRVRLNPFALSVTLEDFRIAEADGGTLFGWDRLYVNLQASTLFTHTISLKAVDWERPYGRVVLQADGQLNVSDLTRRFATPARTPAAAPAQPRAIAVDRLSIRGAQLALEDRSRTEPFATTLGPLSLELDGFRTARDSRTPHRFTGRTEAGESFTWTGSFSLDPLRADGTLAIDRLRLPKYHPYYRDQVAFELRSGLLSARTAYAFQWSEGHHLLKLVDAGLTLEDLTLAAPGKGEPALRLPSLAVQGVQADLLAREVRIDSVQARDGRINLIREADGSLSLVKLLSPKPAPKPKEPAEPFQLQVRELGLKGFTLACEDRRVRPVPLLAEQVDLTLQGFSLDPAGTAKLGLSLRLNGKARLQAEGTLAPLRPGLDLNVRVDGLELPAFDPYLAPASDIRLNRGTLSLQGHLRGSFQGRPEDAASFQGELRVEQFEAMDGAGREPFLAWRSLRLAGIDLNSRPATARLRSIDLDGLEGRLVVASDGRSNLDRALKRTDMPAKLAATPDATPDAKPAATPDAKPAATPDTKQAAKPGAKRVSNPAAAPLSLTIDRFGLKAGRLSFQDRSISPPANLQLTGLEGSYGNLSTRPDSRSELLLKGLAGGIAPVTIQGHALVLRRDQETDLAFSLKGSDLSDFSPYGGKFLGYTIHKGKLEVDARIRIHQRALDAELKTRLDQFYLGEPTASPEATHLPIKLGLALLRDRKGVIDLDLPIQGSLDDPDFHYGRIVWKAVLNVFSKVLASPFTLLGKLAGSGDQDLSFVPFPAGSAVPDAEASTRLQALARVMAERPDLSLEAEGAADPVADAAALRRQALERLLLQARSKAIGEATALPAEERPRWLKAAFDAAFPSASPAAAGKAGKRQAAEPVVAPPLAEMEQRLLATLSASPAELRELADARSKALLKFLMAAKVEAARLFEVEGTERAHKEGGSRVYLGLR